APSSAPTIPPQNRSGTKTVKCQRATPRVNQTSAAIRWPPSSGPPVLSLAPLAPALLLADAPQRGGTRLAELGTLGLAPAAVGLPAPAVTPISWFGPGLAVTGGTNRLGWLGRRRRRRGRRGHDTRNR